MGNTKKKKNQKPKQRTKQQPLPSLGPGKTRLIFALSTIGLLISLYLVYLRFAGSNTACIAGSGCDTVQASQYSVILGIPVALLGAIGYLAIMITSVLRTQIAFKRLALYFLALS